MASPFQAAGNNTAALFTLKIHRGEGMALLAMNWKNGTPPPDFVGFSIEYKEPGSDKFFSLKNRLCFPDDDGNVNPNKLSSKLSPIQKFRWVHFPRHADLSGEFVYRVSPVFMNELGELSYGDPQQAKIELRGETYPKKLNVTFTRGFVASQAFVDRYEAAGPISDLIPAKAAQGLTFRPTHPKAKEALQWMGFEARKAILAILDEAIADSKAQVRVIAYDLNEPDVVSRIEKLKSRVKVIIDNDGAHGESKSAERQAELRLQKSAGKANVKRQHMGKLQHNKTIVVNGPKTKAVVCGSTNLSWRGFFVQSNNAMVLRGSKPVAAFESAFDHYWTYDDVAGFGSSGSASWAPLGIDGVDARVAFSPHLKKNAALAAIAKDMKTATSSVFYSLAFLYQTPGPVRDSIKSITNANKVFIYGISDRPVGGIVVQKPDGRIGPVSAQALSKNIPEPFKKEPTGGGGTRMHHKFVVLDFDKPSARVYLGSYNFSTPADVKNGENLLLIKDQRVAVAYVVEALRIFDHYHFRLIQEKAKKARKKLSLAKPPKTKREKAWWAKDYSDPRLIRDRELFSR